MAIELFFEIDRCKIRNIKNLGKYELSRFLKDLLMDSSNELLFEYFKADPNFWGEEIVEQEKNEFFELFLNEQMHFHSINTHQELMVQIHKNFFNGYSLCDINVSFLRDVGMKLSNNKLDELKLLIYKTFLSEDQDHIIEFIKPRLKYNNNIYFDLEFEKLTENAFVEVKWFSVSEFNDIQKAIDLHNTFFKCLMCIKENEFNDYLFAIIKYEENDDYHLEMIWNHGGSSKEIIVGKITKFFSAF